MATEQKTLGRLRAISALLAGGALLLGGLAASLYGAESILGWSFGGLALLGAGISLALAWLSWPTQEAWLKLGLSFALAPLGLAVMVQGWLSNRADWVVFGLQTIGGAVSMVGAVRLLEASWLHVFPRPRLQSKSKARLVRSGQPSTEVTVSSLVEGDEIELESGEIVPADGMVLGGQASVDESVLTSALPPVQKAESDLVFAESSITQGELRVKVLSSRAESLAVRIRLRRESLSVALSASDRWARFGVLAAACATAIGLWVAWRLNSPLAGGLGLLLASVWGAPIVGRGAVYLSALRRAGPAGVVPGCSADVRAMLDATGWSVDAGLIFATGKVLAHYADGEDQDRLLGVGAAIARPGPMATALKELVHLGAKDLPRAAAVRQGEELVHATVLAERWYWTPLSASLDVPPALLEAARAMKKTGAWVRLLGRDGALVAAVFGVVPETIKPYANLTRELGASVWVPPHLDILPDELLALNFSVAETKPPGRHGLILAPKSSGPGAPLEIRTLSLPMSQSHRSLEGTRVLVPGLGRLPAFLKNKVGVSSKRLIAVSVVPSILATGLLGLGALTPLSGAIIGLGVLSYVGFWVPRR